MNNNYQALPGTTPFRAMEIDSSQAGFGDPPVYQHFTGPCSTFINVFRQPGNYSIAMAFDRGSFTNFGQAQAPQQAPQAMATRVPTPTAGPGRQSAFINPQFLKDQPETAVPPSSPYSFVPSRSPAPGQEIFPAGPQKGGSVPEGNENHSNYNLRRATTKF